MTDDHATERLLQWAGRRPNVPAARAERVRAGVLDVWRVEVRRRRRWQRVRTTAVLALAALLVAAVGWTVSRPLVVAPVVVVATIERAENVPGASAGASVRAGEWITIASGARMALRTPRGASLRLDEHTRLRLISENTIDVMAGAVYLDTGSEAGPLEIDTPFGRISDIGTQFEIRLVADALRVRVRTGVVSVRREPARQPVRVEAGTELLVTSLGTESRSVPPFAADWQWAMRLAPSLRLEGERLAAFLTSLARENGWRLRYEDAALERAAAAVVLHGSIEGLDAEAALGVALAIADLQYRLDAGDLFVFRGPTRK